MAPQRPTPRKKHITGSGSVHRRGSGLGTGPVGSQNGYSGRSSGRRVSTRAAAGGGGGLALLVIAFILLSKCNGGGGLLSSLSSLGGGSGANVNDFLIDSGSSQSQVVDNSSSGSTQVNQTVASGSRAKRTNIIGNGQDLITIMVYMCGTDLESKNGMASSDLQEMAAASFDDHINLIIYTGGCNGWKINGISNRTQQIYQIKNGKLTRLEDNLGTKAMTAPETLGNFIQYCKENFPANRNELIFWDHGGGSVSGFGYDETQKSAGSMSLAGISRALQMGGVQFDFIGFDACLMATAENAMMLDDYADYLIASEETEPGIGWYYTNWLTKLGKNPSMSTLEIGKNIVDDFISTCASKCRGQKTTLSVIDLAEFSNTVPDKLTAFANGISRQLTNQEYQTVSNARYATREFAQSSKIDQVDLVDLAENIGSSEGKELASALKNAVKYNRTSSNISNAYGVSIYFPYQRTNKVDSAVSTYNQIGMDDAYSQCIRQFASLETSGQIAAGGSSAASPISSLLGSMISSGSSSPVSSEMIGSLLSGFMNAASGARSIDGLDETNTAFMNENPLSQEDTAELLALNYFDTSNLIWKQSADGSYLMDLPEQQWSLVHRLDRNVFFDDGTGYIDLGLDNTYDFDEDGALIADTEKTWRAINGQPVAYYHTDTTEIGDQYTMTGYVPALLNHERVQLIIICDNDNPSGYIAGAAIDYVNGETDTVAKNMIELEVGDTLDFVCDYYSYDGTYMDSYYLGEQMIVTEDMVVSDVYIDDNPLKITYCFTDIYNQEHWTESIDQ